jgi:signal transduction histidine kinase
MFVLVSVVALIGLVAAIAVAAAGGMQIHSTVSLLAWTIGGSVCTAGFAVLLLFILRRRSALLQLTVASLAPVVAVGAGVAGGSWAMFIAGHDLRVLVVILIGAGTVGVITALVFGSRISKASAELGRLAQSISRESEAEETDHIEQRAAFRARMIAGDAGPVELAGLARELDAALTRLAESRAETAALEQSRRELVAWVSHDLRTPLAGIRAMVEALQDGVVSDPETVDRYHRTIGLEVERLSGLVSDLFELSRIHAGALNLELAAFPIDEVLSDVVAGATLLARAKGVELTSSVSGAPVVSLAAAEMRRAVQNLIDNAIRHTPEGGTIHVEVASDDSAGFALISVEDACGGIPESDIERVFEVAYSGDAARSPGDGRAGLGLAVARGLVEAQSGDVSVRNADQGCRFTIRIPLAK